ncbi:hypothetical protein [Chryseobacterium artocarpi]|uniref:hypothetical protein n=1 Tax=Chryseobacterium artocarpi TaxID=1414727 RepID=UPI003F3A019C
MKFTYWGKGLLAGAMVLAVSTNSVLANEPSSVLIEKTQNDPDSLKIENLAKELKKLKPIVKADFKAKFKKEVAGFTLTEVTAFEDKETGSYATANYKKGDKNVYLMVTDGAGVGAEAVKTSLLNYLEIKSIEEPGDKTNIKPYKGWQVLFDSSMYESDDMTSIQYLEGNRFSVIASGNMISITDLKAFLDNISL